jgi:hypothetical protein
MHDPMVVAHEIRRPWPSRSSFSNGERRWQIRYSWATWRTLWKPGTYRAFWTLAGREFFFPALVVVWHVEPGGRDCGEVCKHWRTKRDGQRVPDRRWKWHIRHWKLQFPPLQALRRSLLTRCAWCGGRSRKGDQVNCSHQWDGPRGKWWHGEPGLFHADCSSIERAHATCLCADPLLSNGDYGRCAFCGKFRAWRQRGEDATRTLASVPAGQRDPRAYAEACRIWKDIRDREVAAEENPS